MTDAIFDEDLALVQLSFFVAHGPQQPLELRFTDFTVDGAPLALGREGDLPAAQGPWVDMGLFEIGKTFTLGWAFRTGIRVPQNGLVRCGYFPNGRLTKAVRLEAMTVEAFRDYSGTVVVTPVKP